MKLLAGILIGAALGVFGLLLYIMRGLGGMK